MLEKERRFAMKARFFIVFALAASLILPGGATSTTAGSPSGDGEPGQAFAEGGHSALAERVPPPRPACLGPDAQAGQFAGQQQAAAAPLTLNMSSTEPGSLDPALATDTSSSTVIEQLFIGLVDLDDETSEVRPELANAWTVSPDGTVYTFTLRSDVSWSDGRPVTAQDVRYGILRSLTPATASGYAYVLGLVIKNAAAYNAGSLTDPNQVGVTALDDTHLCVTLEHAASYALSIFSLRVARPMPQWAIEAHGTPTWTYPANIVTNGAYRLSEWVPNDHILLDKNPTYYDAANVQIEHVRLWMVDEATAWTMYVNGQLDTVNVPIGTSLDPVLRQHVHIQPRACTYYYGFTTSQPPFDNALVRKAFAAATDRQGLIDNVTRGGQRVALTFTPPGVFGHVDGVAEGVGLAYNPSQARQWLSEAGYPNGLGLPPVSLWFNTSTGHQAIAEYIRDSWYTTLGVSVTLQNMAWQDYLGQIRTGQFQVWRQGWCLDYPDANNFVRELFSRGGYENPSGGSVNWDNPTFESLVAQAAREQDPAVRKALYKQAEEILVETDAVIIPLYHYNSFVANQPHLERSYAQGGTSDIATWRLTRVSGTASPDSGGSLVSYYGDTTLQIPAGAVTNTIVITQSPAYGTPPGGNLASIGHVFDVSAVYSSTDPGTAGLPARIVPGHTYTLAVHYTDAEKGPAIESTLALYYWDGSQWLKEDSSQVDTVANIVSAQPNHFSLWAVLGETRQIFLPAVLRNY
jgi:oligopeptide transport system substrate-binding protein